MSDPGTGYRSRDEIKDVRGKHDPIKILSDKILSNDLLTKEILKDIEDKNKRIIEEAMQQALKDEEPVIQDMFEDIYCENNEVVKGIAPRSIL